MNTVWPAWLALHAEDDVLRTVLGLGVAAAIGLFIYYQYVARDVREQEMRGLADRLRLRYSRAADLDRPPCPAFHLGNRRRTLHTLTGEERGRLIQLGDYEFDTIELGHHLHVLSQVRAHPFSYVQVQVPGAIFEAVVLQPRPQAEEVGAELGVARAAALVAHNLNENLGGQVVPLQDPALAERYILHTEDPEYARALLTPALAQVLTAAPPRMLYFGAWGLIVLQGERCWAAEELAQVLQFVHAVIDALPPGAYHRQVE